MDNQKVGALIATCRKQKNMTQQQLAETIGVTNKAVSKWETGEGCPDINNIAILVEILRISADELLAGELKSSGTSCGSDTQEQPRINWVIVSGCVGFGHSVSQL